MFPFVVSLALAFFSFICSAFVILRILIPILPPHPFSRRVAPAEFGLPNYRSLSVASKSHLWLAALEIISVAVFMWEVVSEYVGGPIDYAITQNAGSSVRLWLALTLRQACLLIVVGIALLHVRLAKRVSFGSRHWILVGPLALLVITSTALAGVLTAAGIQSLFIGLVAYSSGVASLTTIVFVCLIVTLFNIKRNLSSVDVDVDPWPPVRTAEDKPRPSFTTDEVDAIRDGASWITSTAGSRPPSVSAWSFSTHQDSGRSQNGHNTSVHPKSSFWFGSSTPPDAPPVPPLPSPYGPISPTSATLQEFDPFRRDMPTPPPDAERRYMRGRLGSQDSWLTSSAGTRPTMTAWSFPATRQCSSSSSETNASVFDLNADLLPSPLARPSTPALSTAQVLGGYGYTGQEDIEKANKARASVNVSVLGTVSWLVMIWIPVALSLPYLCIVSQNTSSTIASILLPVSVCISSPLLVLNIIIGAPIPIPVGLFDARTDLPAPAMSGSTLPGGSNHPYKFSCASTSATVVEGRRSGDVWIEKGEAVDGKGKLGRAIEMMNPRPKLSVLPPEETNDESFPPVPIRMDDSSLQDNSNVASETSAQFGRLRKESKASSHLSGQDLATQILLAQRHYSAVAKTYLFSGPSDDKRVSVHENMAVATGAEATDTISKPSSHLRARSVTSVNGPGTPTTNVFMTNPVSPSPPPPFPLPPTPPSVRAARLAQMKHKKSFSSGFTFGPVDDMNEIDALTAGVLPLLVPGLTVGKDMKIKDEALIYPSLRKRQSRLEEFGMDIPSPDLHSTPARRPQARRRTSGSGHKRNHYSLPSLGLGKDGSHSLTHWSADINRAIVSKVGQYTSMPSNIDFGRRNTVFGSESIPNTVPHPHLTALDENKEAGGFSNQGAKLSRNMSTRSLGLTPDVPHNVTQLTKYGRPYTSSIASTPTLFEFEGDQELDLMNASPPQAESTPHNSVAPPWPCECIPPLPTRAADSLVSSSRQSSVVYIRSDDMAARVQPDTPPKTAFGAVKALMNKPSFKQRQSSHMNESSPPLAGRSQRRGLRPLSLLQDRNINAVDGENANAMIRVRPLAVGKKVRRPVGRNGENAAPSGSDAGISAKAKARGLKPLQLGKRDQLGPARFDTNQSCAALRENENLPNVVVRPPSDAIGYGY
ncbi:hypothetical protein FISHEDRAFT_35514 [Fistulina hepatica ATCC 64428]|uniref:Uncharacterized protein n=1 Tax=Fistulina hepatica ATCC 64428 TaxID=1128425 RepID=A0A0D7ANH9_9AGAR|nr:hypothetical protein FISHEDRAFT_35514 [Fistulina hepatica ATCC 64428]